MPRRPTILLSLSVAAFCLSALTAPAPAGIPHGYYDRAEGKAGTALEEALTDIVSQNHHRFSYRELWAQLAYTDADPKRPGHVILIYTGRSHPVAKRVNGQGHQPDHWNREHVWAKSHGFKSKGFPAHTDLHHVRAADQSTNEDRDDMDFDVSSNPHPEAIGARIDDDSFEPPDRVKGDVARMMFYMDVRYARSGAAGDLELVNHTTTDSKEPKHGNLCTLLTWHGEDPVDEAERFRHERIFERQGNRNPFIDRPDFANLIWGPECGQ